MRALINLLIIITVVGSLAQIGIGYSSESHLLTAIVVSIGLFLRLWRSRRRGPVGYDDCHHSRGAIPVPVEHRLGTDRRRTEPA